MVNAPASTLDFEFPPGRSEPTTRNGPALLPDIAERALVLLLGSWLIYRFLPTLDAHPFNTLVLLSEGLAVVLIVVRRFGTALNTLQAWSVAMAGSFLPLLVVPVGAEWIPPALAVFMMMLGLLLSVAAKLFLQRSFGIVAANRGVERRGPYRIVRHPMYLGYLLSNMAFLGMSFSGWNVAVYTAAWLAMIIRIALEEQVLSADAGYVAYRQKVRWRLVPGLW
jgi:protein-S-isoprenylcysteine O-methyltransferase Ste14